MCGKIRSIHPRSRCVRWVDLLEDPLPNSASCRLGPAAELTVPGMEMSVNGMLPGSGPIQAVGWATPVVGGSDDGGAEHDALFHLLQQHPRVTRLPPAPLAGRAGRLGLVQAEQLVNPGTSGHGNLLLCIGNRGYFPYNQEGPVFEPLEAGMEDLPGGRVQRGSRAGSSLSVQFWPGLLLCADQSGRAGTWVKTPGCWARCRQSVRHRFTSSCHDDGCRDCQRWSFTDNYRMYNSI